MSLYVKGQRVDVLSETGNWHPATVKYVGDKDGQKGIWVGLALDPPTWASDGHNGTVDGRVYFKCPDRSGLLWRETSRTIRPIGIQSTTESSLLSSSAGGSSLVRSTDGLKKLSHSGEAIEEPGGSNYLSEDLIETYSQSGGDVGGEQTESPSVPMAAQLTSGSVRPTGLVSSKDRVDHSSQPPIANGSRVEAVDDHGKIHCGKVRFTGKVYFRPEICTGIELDKDTEGCHTGTYLNYPYFCCPDKRGLIVPVESVRLIQHPSAKSHTSAVSSASASSGVSSFVEPAKPPGLLRQTANVPTVDSGVVPISLSENLPECLSSPPAVAHQPKIFGLSHIKASARQFQFVVEDLWFGAPVGLMKRCDMGPLLEEFETAAKEKGGLIVKVINFHLEAPLDAIEGIPSCRLTLVLDEIELIVGEVDIGGPKKEILADFPIPISLLPKLQPGKEHFQDEVATVVRVKVQGRLVNFKAVPLVPNYRSFQEAFLVDNTFNPTLPARLRIFAFPADQKELCEQMESSTNLEVKIVGLLSKDPNKFNFNDKLNLRLESITPI